MSGRTRDSLLAHGHAAHTVQWTSTLGGGRHTAWNRLVGAKDSRRVLQRSSETDWSRAPNKGGGGLGVGKVR